MKKGLIRLKQNKNIFYDSIEGVYRYRVHCPECKKVLPNCQCYHDLDVLLSDIEDKIADYTCCAKCCLVDGDWNELGEAMQAAGLERGLRKCLAELTNEQSLAIVEGYDLTVVLSSLFCKNSDITFYQVKHPTHEDRLDIIWQFDDVREVLCEYDISYYPECEDLSEQEAQRVLDILTDGGDFDSPSGYTCGYG